jgi:NTE family protein
MNSNAKDEVPDVEAGKPKAAPDMGLAEAVFMGLTVVLGLYVAGAYLWDAFRPEAELWKGAFGLTQGLLHGVKKVFVAFGIFLLFGVIGVVGSVVVREVLRLGERFVWAPWVLVALILGWILTSGSDYFGILIVTFFIACLVALPFGRFVFKLDSESEPRASAVNKWVLVLLAAWWCSYSALDWWWEGRSPLPLKHAEGKPADGAPAESRKVRVGLALSGGGYRAALVHAGVISKLDEKLREKGVAITHLSTVSGGSIVGAFYAAGGNMEDFRDAVGSGRLNLFRVLSTVPNVARLGFPFQVPFTDVKLFPWYTFGRSDVQAELLDRVLFQGKKHVELSRGPELQICATDLISGDAVGISRKDWIRLPGVSYENVVDLDGVLRPKPHVPKRITGSGEESLAKLVAASGAFPGAFNAVRLKNSKPGLLLSDGGLTDNLGIALLLARHYHEPDWKVDLVIVSDGGASFNEKAADLIQVFDELPRALDVVYKSAGWRSDPTKKLPPGVFLRATDVKEANDLLPLWKTFDETGTLSAVLGKENAQKLFNLGEKLVEKNWDRLRVLLDGASKTAATRS